MKISQPKNRKKVFIIMAVIAAILLAGAGVFAWSIQNTNNDSNPQTNTNTSNDSREQDSNKDQASSDATQKQEFLDNEARQQETDNSQPAPSNEDIVLSAKTDGNNVIVTTKLTSVASGTCTLTVTGGPTPVTQQAAVIYNSEYSTCAGFTVKKDIVNSSSWNIALSVDTGSAKIEKTIKYTP